jgi:anti-sigma B factor antagonist
MSFSYKIIYQSPDKVEILLNGKLLDKNQALDLLSKIEEFYLENKPNVYLDLKELQYLNSSGLNVLIQILTKARNNGAEVYLRNIPEEINKLLLITKLKNIFKIEE